MIGPPLELVGKHSKLESGSVVVNVFCSIKECSPKANWISRYDILEKKMKPNHFLFSYRVSLFVLGSWRSNTYQHTVNSEHYCDCMIFGLNRAGPENYRAKNKNKNI